MRRLARPGAAHADQVVLNGLVAEHRVARGALLDDVGGKPRARLAVDPRIGNLDLGKYAAVDADEYLQGAGPLVTARAGQPHYVRRQLDEVERGHVERDVGREIRARIVHLVE